MVLDGELVVAQGAALDFEVLAQRIHPAESRVTMLSEQTPAWFVAFDLLEDAAGVHLDAPFAERRVRLEAAAADWQAPFFLTPATADVGEARTWFETFEGAGMDGVMAKPVLDPYAPGKRTLTKVKHQRTADCVVAGYRQHKSGPVVGSLLLGLSRRRGPAAARGRLLVVHRARRRKELVDELAPLVIDIEDHPWDPAQRRRGRHPASGRGQPLERQEGHGVRPAPRPSGWPRWRTTSCRATTGSGTTRGSRRWRPDRDARVVPLRPARAPGLVRRRRGAAPGAPR